MKKSITKNYIYNLIYQILTLALPLITTPYISRVLGAENIGIYSYTISISTYFILFGSLGIALYGQREIAYLQDKKEAYSKTFWEVVILRFITMSIAMLIFYITFVSFGQYKLYYTILLLELVANCIDISWFFGGLEEFKKTVSRNIIVKIISIICIFTFVKSSSDLKLYFWIYVLSVLIGNVSLWLYLPKYLEKVYIKDLKIWRHFKSTIALFIPQIAIQIYTVLDKVMIGSIILDKSEVGYYEQSQKIVKVLLTIVTSLVTVMAPRMANTFINGDNEKMKQYMKKSFNFVFLLSFPMVFGLITVSKRFVPIFFGVGYEKVAILMNVISPIIIAIGLSGVIGTQYLLPTKKQKEFTISVTVGAITNFFINLLLIGKYGGVGASIGTVIAETCVTIAQFILIKKEFEIKAIFKLSIQYFVSSTIMFGVCGIIGKIINNSLYCIITQVCVGTIVYISCLLILKNEFIYSILDNIKQKLRKEQI